MEAMAMEEDPSLSDMIRDTIGGSDFSDFENERAVGNFDFERLYEEEREPSDFERTQKIMAATPVFPQAIDALIPMRADEATYQADIIRRFKSLSRVCAVALSTRAAAGLSLGGEQRGAWLSELQQHTAWLGLEHLTEKELDTLRKQGEVQLSWLDHAQGRFGELWAVLMAWEFHFMNLARVCQDCNFTNITADANTAFEGLEQLATAWSALVVRPLNNPGDSVFGPGQKEEDPGVMEFYHYGIEILVKSILDFTDVLNTAETLSPFPEAIPPIRARLEAFELRLIPKLVRIQNVAYVMEKRNEPNAKTPMRERKTMRNQNRPTAEARGLEKLRVSPKGAVITPVIVSEQQARELEEGRPREAVLSSTTAVGAGGVVVSLQQAAMQLRVAQSSGEAAQCVLSAGLANPDHSICFYGDINAAERKGSIAHKAQNMSRLALLCRFYHERLGRWVDFNVVAPGPIFVTSHANEWMKKSLPLLLFGMVEPSSLAVGAELPDAVDFFQLKKVVAKFVQGIVMRVSGKSAEEVPLPYQPGFSAHYARFLGRGPGDTGPVLLSALLDDSRQTVWRELYMGAEALGKKDTFPHWRDNTWPNIEEYAFQESTRKIVEKGAAVQGHNIIIG